MTERVSEAQAMSIITEELARQSWDTASTFTIREGARPGTKDISWWHEKTPAEETADTPRSVAYLRAYLRIGGSRLYAGGLFLKRRRLWMDRSIISRLERDGYIAFGGANEREPYFTLTTSGESLVGIEP